MNKKYSGVWRLLLIFWAILFISTSCQFNKTSKPKSTGSINELLIITDSKTDWEGALGDSLRGFFQMEMIGLTQPEPLFDVINIATKDLVDLYKKYHNIFIAEIRPEVYSASTFIAKNQWAQPQCVITITAPDMAQFFAEFNKNKGTVLNEFIKLERERTLLLSDLSFDMKAAATINSKFGLSLSIPGGFYIAKNVPDFIWLRHTITKAKQDIELGIMIYTSEYLDSTVFNHRNIINWRNMVTREHIPGPSEGSYMVVGEQFIPPVFTEIQNFPAGYAIETRGIWEVKNDFMGGPFLSYTFIHPKSNKVITLDGYVYYPNGDKKAYLRHLEAIFWAVKF